MKDIIIIIIIKEGTCSRYYLVVFSWTWPSSTFFCFAADSIYGTLHLVFKGKKESLQYWEYVTTELNEII